MMEGNGKCGLCRKYCQEKKKVTIVDKAASWTEDKEQNVTMKVVKRQKPMTTAGGESLVGEAAGSGSSHSLAPPDIYAPVGANVPPPLLAAHAHVTETAEE